MPEKEFLAVAAEYLQARDIAAVMAHVRHFAKQHGGCSSVILHELLSGGYRAKVSFTSPQHAAAAVKRPLQPFKGSAAKVMPWSARSRGLPGGECLPRDQAVAVFKHT